MNSKMILRSSLCLGLLAGSLWAQDSKIVAHQSVTQRSPIILPADAPPPGYSVLYSDLGSKTNTYNGNEGWTLSGPNSILGFDQAVAEPYTPKSNVTLNAIQLGLGYVAGTNEAAVAVFSDEGGLPGKSIKVWNVKDVPTFGTCCTLVTVGDKAGIPLAAGTQYWIVVGWDDPSVTFYGVWDYTYNGAQGTFAFASTGNGNVWEVSSGSTTAYALYGAF